MNTRQFQYVLAVAENRSFTAAANQLMIAQPSLSQFINKLELELGQKLFDRSSSPLHLTLAGEIYVETARRMLDMEAQMRQRLQDISGGKKGRLSIGASSHQSLYTLPRVIQRFLELYPYYEVIIREQQPQHFRMQLLIEGELDLCLLDTPVDEEKFDWVEMLVENFILAVPLDHPINDSLTIMADKKAEGLYPMVDLRELQSVPFITVNEKYSLHWLFKDLCKQSGFEPRKVVECDSTQLCQTMVALGIGAAVLHSSCAHYGDFQQKLRYYTILQEYQIRKIGLVYRKNAYLSMAARSFIDIMKDFYSNHP